MMLRFVLAAAALVALLAIAGPGPTRAQGGYVIESGKILIEIQPDGTMHVSEDWRVDFGFLESHGIFRDLRTVFECEGTEVCPSGSQRVYPVDLGRVTANGGPVPTEVSRESGLTSIRIGDPDEVVVGEQLYHIEYSIEAALNAFGDHDELYWNVIGTWDTTINTVNVTVTLPTAVAIDTLCFQGRFGSTQTCPHAAAPGRATFASERFVLPGEEMTVVAGWPKGTVQVQPARINDLLSPDDFFTLDALEVGGALAGSLLALLGATWLWWRHGRDRAYTSLHYLTNDPEEGRRGLFSGREIVVEYLPPEDMRPAQMGLLIDEQADTLDVTSTIIDLACRGYLHITEIPTKGWLGKRDWELEQVQPADEALLPYERRLLNALFNNRQSVKISKLRNTFYTTVEKVQGDLYKDAQERKWFLRAPGTARGIWAVAGLALFLVGIAVSVGVGFLFERALLGLGVALLGVFLLVLSRSMAARTATGSEALRRTLGFRLYVETAEQRLQEFNEERDIFARYLPYAMVFGCV
ncbi:MAG: DUF2207 domain-containing protein, partial [Dehalococcoidia bacterium]